MNDKTVQRSSATFVHRGIAREGYQYCTDNDCKCHMMPPEPVVARSSNPLGDLLRRLREDGGRYLLSVGLTREERNAQPEPTFGGKGHVRWLTDEEYRALCALVPSDETCEGYSQAYAHQMRDALAEIVADSLTSDRVRRFCHKGLLPPRAELKAFVQLCAPHGKDWLTCPECAKAAGIGEAQS